jgi:small-conductance mechanosensitive channel
MRNRAIIILSIVLLWAFFLVPGDVLASQQQEENQAADTNQKPDTPVPDLTEIIPLSANLAGHFSHLKNSLQQGGDFSAIKAEYAAIGADLKTLTDEFDQFKETGDYSYSKIFVLRQAIAAKKSRLESIDKPLIIEIRRVYGWKTEWLSKKEHWEAWQSSLLKNQPPEQLKRVFSKALGTIDTGLELVMQRLENMLALQAKGGDIAGRIDALDADLRIVFLGVRQEYLFSKAPSLVSFEYLSQLRSQVWFLSPIDTRLFSWPGVHFFSQHGWKFLFQVCFFLVVIGFIHRNRVALKASEHWKFLADRPVSSALFVTILTLAMFLAYSSYLVDLRFAYTVFGGVACVRLLGLMMDRSWKKQAAYGVMIVHIVSVVLLALGISLPISRLYIFLVSLMALYCIKRWIKKCSARNESGLYLWLLRMAGALFVVIIIAELWGSAGIAGFLFRSSFQSMAIILPYILFMYIIYGGLHWVFHSSIVWRVKLLRNDADFHVQRFGFLFAAAIVGFVMLPAILMAWGLYDNLPEATAGFYSQGLSLGSLRVSLGLFAALAGTFYGVFLTSRILPKVLLDEVVSGRKLARGVQRSIGQLIRYFTVFVGFVLTFIILGYDFTKITIILSALGVGIGFGLQGVVNNFVSGLILLFERPLTEGDTIMIGDTWANIKKIGLRATIVRTFDEADLIIPNADLINNQVINWTLTNRQVRLRVPVGVAYGSDVPLVVETILECAKEHQEVLKSPAPEVLFMNFGDSSLNFELRVWIQEIDRMFRVKSALYHEIERRFRKLNIVIPFPQRDLHLRGYDGCAGLTTTPMPGNGEEDVS